MAGLLSEQSKNQRWCWCMGKNTFHKSHNASDKYLTLHHFVTEMCTHVHISVTNGVLWDMGLVRCEICEIGLLC